MAASHQSHHRQVAGSPNHHRRAGDSHSRRPGLLVGRQAGSQGPPERRQAGSPGLLVARQAGSQGPPERRAEQGLPLAAEVSPSRHRLEGDRPQAVGRPSHRHFRKDSFGWLLVSGWAAAQRSIVPLLHAPSSLVQRLDQVLPALADHPPLDLEGVCELVCLHGPVVVQ